MKASRRQASIVIIRGLGVIAVLAAVLFGAVWWLSKGWKQSDADATSSAMVSTSDSAARRAEPGAGGRAVVSIHSAISAEPVPAIGKSQSAAAAVAEAPDARAATLVQSFSCASKVSPARAEICTYVSLAMEDYNLSLQYRSALARSGNSQALRRGQAAWLAEFDHLKADTAILKSYQKRRDELSKS